MESYLWGSIESIIDYVLFQLIYWFLSKTLKVGSHSQLKACLALDLLEGGFLRDLSQNQFAVDVLEDSQFSDHLGNDPLRSEGQVAFGKKLHLDITILGLSTVFHHDYDCRSAGHQVHGSTDSLEKFARNHPVGDVAVFADFHRAKESHVEMSTSHNAKGVWRREVGASFLESDGFLYKAKVTLLALILLPETLSRVGKGPMPMIPFSLCKLISTSFGRTARILVGMPIPRLMCMPFLTSWAVLFAILRRAGSLFLLFLAGSGVLKQMFPFLTSFSPT